jgi:hypothetical protein
MPSKCGKKLCQTGLAGTFRRAATDITHPASRLVELSVLNADGSEFALFDCVFFHEGHPL